MPADPNKRSPPSRPGGRKRAAPAARGGRTWKQDPDGRRAQVLAAAEHEIAEKGLTALRTGALAERAGVAEGTIFSLFGSKDGLLVEVGRRWAQGMVEAAFDNVIADPTNPDFEGFVHAIFDYAGDNRELLQAFLWMSNVPSAQSVNDAIRDRVVDAIELALTKRSERTKLPFEDARVAASIQFGLVENALRECFVRGDGSEQDAYRREVAASLRALSTLSPK